MPTAPTFPFMRHPDTRKWFAIIMDVPKDKLGLTGQQRVDVINVKLSDPLKNEYGIYVVRGPRGVPYS